MKKVWWGCEDFVKREVWRVGDGEVMREGARITHHKSRNILRLARFLF